LHVLGCQHRPPRVTDIQQIRFDDVEVTEHHVERCPINLADRVLPEMSPDRAEQVRSDRLMPEVG
jgi:hypothetical protein